MLRTATILATCALVIGGLLAVGFNPDTGTVAHVEPVWEIGGLMVYAGFVAMLALLVYSVGRAIWRALVRAGGPSAPSR